MVVGTVDRSGARMDLTRLAVGLLVVLCSVLGLLTAMAVAVVQRRWRALLFTPLLALAWFLVVLVLYVLHQLATYGSVRL